MVSVSRQSGRCNVILNTLSQGVASVLIALAVLIIFLLVEAYLELGNELPVRSRRKGEGADGGLSHRKAS
jgi:hypothetical protein